MLKPEHIDKLVTAGVEYGAMVVVFAFLLGALYIWQKYAKNGNGKAHDITNKRISDIGNKVSEHSHAIGGIKARLDAMEKHFTKEHKALKELIDNNNTRMHERFDELLERLPALAKKGKE